MLSHIDTEREMGPEDNGSLAFGTLSDFLLLTDLHLYSFSEITPVSTVVFSDFCESLRELSNSTVVLEIL